MKMLVPVGWRGFKAEVDVPCPVSPEEIEELQSCVLDIRNENWNLVTLERIANSQGILLKMLRAVRGAAEQARLEHGDPCEDQHYFISTRQLDVLQDAIWNCCTQHGPLTRVKIDAMRVVGEVINDSPAQDPR